MSQPEVIVVGSCNADLTVYTKQLPKLGETSRGQYFMIDYGGKGANQCIAAAKLGLSTAMVARVGNDIYGHEYMNVLKNNSVNSTYVKITEGVSTGVACITVLSTTGDNSILIVDGANGQVTLEDVKDATDIIKEARVGLFQFEISIETTKEAMKLFKNISKAVLMLNPSPMPENMDPEFYKLLDIIVINETEAEILLKREVKSLNDGYEALNTLIQYGCNIVILTLGKLGALFASQTERQPTPVVIEAVEDPVDTTGAGDLFLGALAYAYVKCDHSSLKEKVSFACNVARECVKKRGSQGSFPSSDDISHIINDFLK